MKLSDPIGNGNTAEIYLVGDNIVKVYLRDSVDAVEHEATNQTYARSLGLPVPKVIDVTQIEGIPALVMEHVPGKTMFNAIGDDWSLFEEYLPVSVQLHRRVHAVIAPDLRPMSKRLANQICAAGQLSDNQKSRLLAMLEEIDDELQLCHGDFHIQNLIVNDDGVTIIDWMDATRGDIRLDVCRTYLLYSMVSTEAARMYLGDYCSQSGLVQEDILRWLPVIAGARLSEHVGETEECRLVRIVDNRK